MSEQTPQPPRRKIPPLPEWFGLAWLLIVGVSAAILNSWASADGVDNNTISAHTTQVRRFVFVLTSVFLGGLMGHFCSRGLDLPELHPLGPIPFLVIVLALSTVDYFAQGWISQRYPFIALASLGFPLGLMLWSMRRVAT